MVEVPHDAGIQHWKGSVGRLVDPYNQEVPEGWRDQVVKLAAEGHEAEAVTQIKAKLVQAGDPYSLQAESGAGDPGISATRDAGIAAWLQDQVKADQLKQSAGAALGATPPLARATRGVDPGGRTSTGAVDSGARAQRPQTPAK
ncbi:hypothetical protein ACIA58_06220 [Kribbella sp. NPDC051586]|uniref:hypothetical protein n=1 Tax=Kribbella sp. NPDC051586 TaxID=3364118 RepID=UPI00379887AB